FFTHPTTSHIFTLSLHDALPIYDWWRHPIFTLRGLWLFWSNLMASFWRGEVSWHGRLLSWGLGDRFFAISTLILLGSATVGLRRDRKSTRLNSSHDQISYAVFCL